MKYDCPEVAAIYTSRIKIIQFLKSKYNDYVNS
jgi:hypothetical protein